ncbi:glycine--tRNA ligase [Candidatus Woesebacteria bacterium]|nr:glycine--tRNA ligase [Candidatus Woesebacteria bacterium]MBP9687196.1 glycine--tRNA ligase [Candidatus Woesebacteria bacterium]
MAENTLMDKVVSLAKRRGFVYQTSEIYGGLANSYDYGPAGTELLRNIKNLWWSEFVQKREDMVGLDSQIILHPKTWVASGHVGSFSDPLVEDLKTHKRYRADHLIEKHLSDSTVSVEDMTLEDMAAFIKDNNIKSPDGNELSTPKAFNLLFETEIGAVSGDKAVVYLRGETAQGIFTNFKQILDSNRVSLPFGVGQIGKSFRNEITTGQFVFRTLEFEQAEIEYFFNPEETKWESLMESWKESMQSFVTNILGIKEENLRFRKHTDTERSHYSLDTYDLEYLFPFGWKELWGIAYRTDYDLKQHIEHSKQTLEYMDPQTGKKFVPHVIEPAVGVNRLFLMCLMDSYYEDQETGRVLLKLAPRLAPYKVAVFPLLANKEQLVSKAREVYNMLKSEMTVAWDARGNIGKRYAAQDEIGTPYCITVDFDSLDKNDVTIRNRDTGEQERVSFDTLLSFLQAKIK